MQSSNVETGVGTGLRRHIDACNNARLPGLRRRFLLDGAPVGWVLPEIAAALAAMPAVENRDEGICLTEPARLPAISRALADAKLSRWRGEWFDVHAEQGRAVLAQVDRGSVPALGVMAVGVHVNGLVERSDGLHLWIARRSATKALDPSKLDHIVAGGVPTGMGIMDTLVKEAGEEASIPPDLAKRAVARSVLAYAMDRAEGLRRDRLHCFDLTLPESFRPAPNDDEVAGFELWPADRVLATLRETEAFKFNVGLVLIDLFLRLGRIAEPEATELSHAMRAVTVTDAARS